MLSLVLHTTSPAMADDTTPDMAFIEFLGEGVEVDQEFVDPVEIDEFNKLTESAQQEDKQHDQ